jgi:hypothetical protein
MTIYATDYFASDSNGVLVMNKSYLIQSDHSIYVSPDETPQERTGKALIIKARDILTAAKDLLSGKDKSKVNGAINKINSALSSQNFIDDNNLSDYGLDFYDDITNAINLVDYLLSSPIVGNKIGDAFDLLYEGSLIFAEMAIEDAAQNCVVSNCEELIQIANSELGNALKGYNKDLFINVLNHLTNAWKHAKYALGTNLKKESANGSSQLPTEYGMDQNYPNPFNPTTQINYQLPENNHVTLQVYDVLGNLVTTLINNEVEAGYHSITWNASGIASGIYFYTLRSGSFVATKKLILLK